MITEHGSLDPVETQRRESGSALKISQSAAAIRKLEEQLIEAQKFEIPGQLVTGMAHDLKNILMVIMGSADLMLSEQCTSNPKPQRLQAIQQAAVQAVTLTQQFLSLARKERGGLVVLDPNDVVNDVANMLRQLVGKSTGFTLSLGNPIEHVKANAECLGQLLLNLVINARDAMPLGGELTVETSNATLDKDLRCLQPESSPFNYVRITVGDTGTGMTDEIKAHLFEPLYTAKPLGKGTGLGLATCYAIVKQCGGHIRVHSEVGQGTTFDVFLPVVKNDSPVQDFAASLGASLPRCHRDASKEHLEHR